MKTLKEMTELGLLKDNIEKEMYGCALFFYNEAQTEEGLCYGLVRDNQLNKNYCSIASIGFALASLAYSAERGWLERAEAERRVVGTLQTLHRIEHLNGFFFHFLKMTDGSPWGNTELSVIDTAIVICGAITAGQYFGGEALKLADSLYKRVRWNFYVSNDKEMFYMGYWRGKGFSGYWDTYAEQLMLYVLGAGADEDLIPKSVYDRFDRMRGGYKDIKFIHTWFGTLFTYQYSHAFIDFRGLIDGDGVDWFQNSVDASLAQYNYCVDHQDEYKSFSPASWGVTACDTIRGYRSQGIPPSGAGNTMHECDGTVAPSAAIGSVVFTPEESLRALDYYMTIDGLDGEYGLKNSFNKDKNWVSERYIGIDKGITLLMLANYRDEFVWKQFMQYPPIREGLSRLKFTKVG